MVSVLLAPLAAGARAQHPEERQLEQAKQRLAELADEIEGAEHEADEAKAALEEADERLRQVEAVVNEVAAAVDRQREVVQEAARRLERVEHEAALVADRFADRAAQLFKQGPGMSFEVVLSASDANDALARTGYLRAVTQADRVNLETLEAAGVAVEAERQRFAEEQQRLEGMLEEQEEILEEVARLREMRALAAAEARQEVEDLHGEQEELEEEQRKLEELIQQRQEEERRRREAAERARREAAAQAAAGGGASSSGFAWPLCGRLTSGFGQRWGRLHAGIDIAAPTGTPVVASKAGTVLYAGWRGGYGQLVLIDHHDGVVTAYAHLNSIGVRQGTSVGGGQRIGRVGSTGFSTGPHLHFETRVNSSPTNPRQYLPGGSC